MSTSFFLPDSQSTLYTGQLAQAELGLDYYVARFYDPLTGHFTQADSIVPEPGKASAFDRYAYVLNNPIRYSDPSGHRDSGECGPGEDCDRKKRPSSWEEAKKERDFATDDNDESMHQLFFQAIPSSTPAKKTIPQSPPTNTPTPRTLLQKGPTKTPTFVNPQNKNPSQGRKQTKVSVNWDNIDVADLVIDVVGLLGDIAIIKPPEGSIGWVITEVIEGASLVKTAYDMCNANPTNATLYTLESEFKYILLVARAERLVPHVGWIGNLVSLGINIIPNTKIE